MQKFSARLSIFPKFEAYILSLPYAPRMPRHMVRQTKKPSPLARKFNQDVARPLALGLDRKTHEDPDYMPWEPGWSWPTNGVSTPCGYQDVRRQGLQYAVHVLFSEEVGSVCVGITNVIGVHYLGVAG